MSETTSRAFDPYHVWLGIPPHEQPPNHYRLLGIVPFEDHADVIESAADRQMGHLRNYQSGKHSAFSQKLLNQVATAKVCLLNAAKKAVYDEQLRQTLAAATTTTDEEREAAKGIAAQSAGSGSVFPGFKPAANEAHLAIDTSGPAARYRSAIKPRRSSAGPLIGVAVGGLLLVTAIVIWSTSNRDRGDRQSTATNAAADSQPTKSPAPKTTPATRTQEPVRPEGMNVTTPKTPRTPDPRSADTSVAPPEKPPMVSKTQADRAPEFVPSDSSGDRSEAPVFKPSGDVPENSTGAPPKSEPVTSQADPAASPKKHPVPDEAVQRQIAERLQGIYSPAKAKTPAEKLKLASQLFSAGEKSQAAGEQYVLLRTAMELARDGGDAALMLDAVRRLGASFDFDVRAEEDKAAIELAAGVTQAEGIKALVLAAGLLIDRALSNTLEGLFCLEALKEALGGDTPKIFNTNQGMQYTDAAYTVQLRTAGVAVSMDGRGLWMDNVFVADAKVRVAQSRHDAHMPNGWAACNACRSRDTMQPQGLNT